MTVLAAPVADRIARSRGCRRERMRRASLTAAPAQTTTDAAQTTTDAVSENGSPS